MPVTIFAYCYGRIFYIIRRQRKARSGRAGRSQDVPIATISRDQTTGQIQQQATQATTDAKLSPREMNVLQTMIVVIVCFIVCWAPVSSIAVVDFVTVSTFALTTSLKVSYQVTY